MERLYGITRGKSRGMRPSVDVTDPHVPVTGVFNLVYADLITKYPDLLERIANVRAGIPCSTMLLACEQCGAIECSARQSYCKACSKIRRLASQNRYLQRRRQKQLADTQKVTNHVSKVHGGDSKNFG